MKGFSNLGVTLTSIFSLLLLALLAEIIYLLWRRRQQIHQKRTRIKPTGPGPTSPSTNPELPKPDGLYGPPSRALFTIKEEERDEIIETELSLSLPSIVLGERKTTGVTAVTLSLEDHLRDFQVQVTGESSENVFEVEPPFLTPCGSPPYYTPSSSPSRERK